MGQVSAEQTSPQPDPPVTDRAGADPHNSSRSQDKHCSKSKRRQGFSTRSLKRFKESGLEARDVPGLREARWPEDRNLGCVYKRHIDGGGSLLFPYSHPDGSPVMMPNGKRFWRSRPHDPGQGPKYLSPKGSSTHLYWSTLDIARGDLEKRLRGKAPVVIVEGEFKTQALTTEAGRRGLNAGCGGDPICVGIGGLSSWKGTYRQPVMTKECRDERASLRLTGTPEHKWPTPPLHGGVH